MRIPFVRTMVKELVKGGLGLADAVKSLGAAAGRQWDRSATDARARLRRDAKPIPSESTPLSSDANGMTDTTEAIMVDTPVVEEPPPAAQAEETPKARPGLPGIIDVDGIGPGVTRVLADSGISTLEQLATMASADLAEILSRAGAPYRSMDPTTWPDQARHLTESSRPKAEASR